MRTFPVYWNSLIIRLGLRRKPSLRRSCIHRRSLAFEMCECRRMLAPIMVTSNADNTISGDGLVTLREAIASANQLDGPDTITFDPAVFNTPKTIQLTQGQLHISDSLQIEGLGPNRLTVKADDPDGVAGNFDDPSSRDGHRIFLIRRSPTVLIGDNTTEIDVTISGLTLTGGEVAWMLGDPDPGQLGFPDFRFEGGGAILNYENLTLVNSVISNSHAQNGGGAMTTYNATTIRDCIISNNTSVNGGGGIGAQLVNGVVAADSTKFCAIWTLAA